MQALWQNIIQLVQTLLLIIGDLGHLMIAGSLVLAWLAWSLFAINWPKTWRALAEGAWVPLILLFIASALVWSQLAPATATLFGFLMIGNFWWQLGAIGLLACVTLFCGWLQEQYGWSPAEISLEPVAHHGHDHGHGHEHGHDEHAPGVAATLHHEPAHH